MSDLQLGLVLIGVLVVVGVMAYNRVQERAAQRRADAAFKSDHADALLDPGGAEPAPAVREHAHRHPEGGEPGRAAAPPDARLDYVVELQGDGAVAAVAVLEQWRGLARRFKDRVQIAGSSGEGRWHALGEGDNAAYARYCAGLQLVTRTGVVGEAELIEFRSEVENLAAKAGLHAASPEMKAALESARELDAFCADRDIQVALHVVSKAPDGIDRQAVLALGERHGLALEADGRFSHRDIAGRLLFHLADRSGARLDAQGPAVLPLMALSLTMDVPRAPDTQRSFEAMARLAGSLAGELGGVIVDDNANALDERSLAAIEAQLAAVSAQLGERGFAPGEALALRLFS